MTRKVFIALFFSWAPALLLTMACFSPVAAQAKMTPAQKQAAVDSLARLMEDNYVFPALGRQIAANLRARLKEGYFSAEEPSSFADEVTRELRAVNDDRHLGLRFNPEFARELRQPEPADGEEGAPPSYLAELRRDNYGFQEMKILDGNVGYLDLRAFMDPELAGEVATAAMNYLSNADAIIFDLRRNGGGSPQMIQLLSSYLYDAGRPVHLNNFYFRPTNDTSQTWTLPYVPGKRNPKAKVFVLTSNYTFSAAEEFTYNLKNLKRATIVGETTGGGAHPGRVHPVGEQFVVFIPNGRAFNPLTGTNWEGAGVEPDVKIEAAQALNKAHLMALETLAESASDEASRNFFQWHYSGLKAMQEPVNIPARQLQSYAGVYGGRELSVENGKLYYQRQGRSRQELQALQADTFAPVGVNDIRFTIEMNQGQPVALLVRYQDGRQERFERVKNVKP